MSEKKWINIRDFYPDQDNKIIEVTAEVKELLNIFFKESEAQRKRDRRNLSFVVFEEETIEDLCFMAETSLEEKVIQSLETELLKSAMHNLTEVQKERLYLYFFEGMNYSEIARRQGVSVRSVFVCIDTAISRLREQMKRE